MNTISSETDVHAPVRAIYDILLEPSYVPRLYPDLLTIVSDPPGRMVVGQKYHITGKAGRRRLEILAEAVETVPDRKVVTRHVPGGLFKSFEETVLLEEKGSVTHVTATFQYELSLGYLGRVFNMLLLERLVMDNLKAYTRNLKDICELLPVEARE